MEGGERVSSFEEPQEVGSQPMSDKQPLLLEIPKVELPAFRQDDMRPYQSVKIRFRNKEDRDRCAALSDLTLTSETKEVWWPKAEIRNISVELAALASQIHEE